MKPGDLYITTSDWIAWHMRKNSHGIWVPEQKEEKPIFSNSFSHIPSVYSVIIKSQISKNSPVLYIATNGLPHVGIFLFEDILCELPYNLLKKAP
jgi:hypothetical protein